MYSDKDELRQIMLEQRCSCTQEQALIAGARIWQNIESKLIPAVLKRHSSEDFSAHHICVGTYCSDSTEPDFSCIIYPKSTEDSTAVLKHICIALPTVRGQQLVFRVHDPMVSLCRGKLGISEPKDSQRVILANEIDVLLVPGVAFDTIGGRLGRGGGYYDRFLSSIPEDSLPLLIGVCHDFQLIDYVPTYFGDFPMDIVVTPERFIDISGRFVR